MSDKPIDATGFDSSRGVGKHDFVKSSTAAEDKRALDRQPFWAHCADCKHEWVVFWTPMDISKVAEIGKRSICPACGETKVMCGKAP
jgi:Zn finger protein HypA/HybF involved in hydrogenase expression